MKAASSRDCSGRPESSPRSYPEKSEAAEALRSLSQAARLCDQEKSLVAGTAWRLSGVSNWTRTLSPLTGTILQVVSGITGVPVSNLTETEASRLRTEDILHQHVVGQDEAVVKGCKNPEATQSSQDPKRPGGSFIFLGPSRCR